MIEEYINFFQEECGADVQRKEDSYFNGQFYAPVYAYIISFDFLNWNYKIFLNYLSREPSTFSEVVWRINCSSSHIHSTISLEITKDSSLFTYLFKQSAYVIKSSNKRLEQSERKSNNINSALQSIPYQIIQEVRTVSSEPVFTLESEFSSRHLDLETMKKVVHTFKFICSQIEYCEVNQG